MSKGQWNLRNPRGGDLAFVEGASIRSYLVVNFERSANTGAIMKFVDMFERWRAIGACSSAAASRLSTAPASSRIWPMSSSRTR